MTEDKHLTRGLFTLPPQSEQSKAAAAAAFARRKGMYAAMPGTGPAGETCKSCRHIDHTGRGGRYIKCGLTRDYRTHGAGTDIKAGSPACNKWEKAIDSP